jgi:hypothetical protein
MMTSSSSHRTPRRRSSGFNPAAKVGQNEVGERQYSLASNERDEYDRDRETLRPDDAEVAHLTKTGKPDRRFKGQREIPDEEIIDNPNYVQPTTAIVDEEGIHVSPKTGKPDLRFKENRGLTEEEVNRKWAEKLAKEYGIIDKDE